MFLCNSAEAPYVGTHMKRTTTTKYHPSVANRASIQRATKFSLGYTKKHFSLSLSLSLTHSLTHSLSQCARFLLLVASFPKIFVEMHNAKRAQEYITETMRYRRSAIVIKYKRIRCRVLFPC